MTSDELRNAKADFVRRTFFNTADDNYIAARWCYSNKMPADFHWLAVHALEKYIKAALLMNEKSAKRDGHNVVQLYQKLATTWPQLLPSMLTVPEEHQRGRPNEAPINFLQRLYANGNEHNRYAFLGYAHYPLDILLFDQMVFAVRRMCVPLAEPALPRKPEVGLHADFLQKDPQWRGGGAGAPLDKAITGKRGDVLQLAACNLNYPFAPHDFDHGSLPGGLGAGSTPLYQYVLDSRIRDGAGAVSPECAKELKEWLLNNVFIPRDIKSDLDSAWPPTS